MGLCSLATCGKVASFLLYRYLGSQKPALLAYCEIHAEQVAEGLGVEMPNKDKSQIEILWHIEGGRLASGRAESEAGSDATLF